MDEKRKLLLLRFKNHDIRTFCVTKGQGEQAVIEPAKIALEDCFRIVYKQENWRNKLDKKLSKISKTNVEVIQDKESGNLHLADSEGISQMLFLMVDADNQELCIDLGIFIEDRFCNANDSKNPLLACVMPKATDVMKRAKRNFLEYSSEELFELRTLKELIDTKFDLQNEIVSRLLVNKLRNKISSTYQVLDDEELGLDKKGSKLYDLMDLSPAEGSIEDLLKNTEWVNKSLKNKNGEIKKEYKKLLDPHEKEIEERLASREEIEYIIVAIWDISKSDWGYKILEEIVKYKKGEILGELS